MRVSFLFAALLVVTLSHAQTTEPNNIEASIRKLRSLPDSERAVETKKLALDIRNLPAGAQKVSLALDLASRATEGDFGRDTLQEVTTTLDRSLKEEPAASPEPYQELAELYRYEHMKVDLTNAMTQRALRQVDQTDALRRKAAFTLIDLSGKRWSLSALRGKVVLVNFWATWCPPCRKEMPDLESLYKQFAAKGFVILAISDEADSKVRPFIVQHGYSYPILLDPGRKVNTLYKVQGIPKSFVYDRKGNMVAQSIDMRTRGQFLDMLKRAGLS